MKRVLLVDAVEDASESAKASVRSVEQWFGRHLGLERKAVLHTVPASSSSLGEAAEGADGVVISGSPRDAWSEDPEVLRLLGFARQLLLGRQPVLGVCFGHQLLARAAGGDVRRSSMGWEVGATRVHLTPAGVESPLFAGFDEEFAAIQSHRDAVSALPPGATVLAMNAHTPIQAFSLEKRIFGVQFHPEMNGEILRRRWSERREQWRGQVSFDLDHALDSADADASRVLRNFLAILP